LDNLSHQRQFFAHNHCTYNDAISVLKFIPLMLLLFSIIIISGSKRINIDILTIVFTFLLFILPFMSLILRNGIEFVRDIYRGENNHLARNIFIGLFAGLALYMLFGAHIGALAQGGYPTLLYKLKNASYLVGFIIGILANHLLIMVLVSVMEEFLTTYIIYRGMRNKHGVLKSAVVSSLFFSMLHIVAFNVSAIVGISAMLSALIIGVSTCLLYERNGSFSQIVMLHAAWNIATMAFAALNV